MAEEPSGQRPVLKFERSRNCRLLSGQGVIQGGERGNDGGFRTQDQAAKRGFLETAALRGLELRVGPATFRADRQSHGRSSLSFQNRSQGWRVGAFGEQQA